jgi:hypothetical protein
LKTGYGTQERVLVQLDALGLTVDAEASRNAMNTLIIGDFEAEIQHNEHTVVIHDVIDHPLMHELSLAGQGSHERVTKYKKMKDAIAQGKHEEAEAAVKSFGWELDALKFIPGLVMAYERMPNKKWYILVDDDTYLVQGSLQAMLDRLDSSKPEYLGNAVGDFKGRFAHGGSAVILSQAAMALLFKENKQIIPEAYVASLNETWGDKLLATTFHKVGVYLDERYNSFFNGERPQLARIMADRLCSPIISFHGLAKPQKMAEVGTKFSHVRGLVTWGHIWKLYSQPDMASFAEHPIRKDYDHVGRPDEAVMTIKATESSEKCMESCVKHHKTCLAWTWDSTTKDCHISPWVVIGEVSPGKFTGLNHIRIDQIGKQCAS